MNPSDNHDANLTQRAFERILLVKPSSLGDIVHALPVLHGLRTAYPDAMIDWLVASPFVPLIESHPEVDNVVPFDRARFSRLGRSLAVTADFVRFVKDLRRRKYDLAIDLQGLFRTGFLTWASGAAVRIGFRDAREGAAVFYSHKISPGDLEQHAVDRNYRVAEMLGFEEVEVEFDLALTDAIRAEASELLKTHIPAPYDELLFVAPGARWETKVWPVERFAATIDALQGASGLRCVLLGGRDEVTLCAGIEQACRTSPVNLAGRTSLSLLPALIERAAVVLCQDSAVMHLAVALNRPLVCLIGPTNPRRTGPYLRLEDVVSLDVDCSPCYLRKLSQCGHDHRCMKDLEVGPVVEAVERRLEAARLPSGGSTIAT